MTTSENTGTITLKSPGGATKMHNSDLGPLTSTPGQIEGLGNLNRHISYDEKCLELFRQVPEGRQWSSEDMDRDYRSKKSFSEQIEQKVGHFIRTQSRRYCHSSLCLT